MFRIKKNDTVMVTSGKDKGKTGKVLRLFPKSWRVLVEGVNLAKKALRRTQKNQQGGLIHVERTVSLSNIMPFCKNCQKPVRVGYSLGEDKTKGRYCRLCKHPI